MELYNNGAPNLDSTSTVAESATVNGAVTISNHSVIVHAAVVEGFANVNCSGLYNYSHISGMATVQYCDLYDNVHIYGNAEVRSVVLKDNVHIFGGAKIVNNYGLNGLTLTGNCKFGGKATFENLNTPTDFRNKYGADHIAVRKLSIASFDIIIKDVWDMG